MLDSASHLSASLVNLAPDQRHKSAACKLSQSAESETDVKKIRNRQAASKCRAKKLEQVRRTKQCLAEMISENNRLTKEIQTTKVKLNCVLDILKTHAQSRQCQLIKQQDELI